MITARASRRTAALSLLLIGRAAMCQQPARFVVDADTILTDAPFRLAVLGAPPAADVTIAVDGNRGQWQSTATFRSVRCSSGLI